MKKIIALLAFLAALISPVQANFAYVNGYDGVDINTTTTVPIASVVYANGETVFLGATYGCAGRITESIADGGTNTYAYIGTQYDAGNGTISEPNMMPETANALPPSWLKTPWPAPIP